MYKRTNQFYVVLVIMVLFSVAFRPFLPLNASHKTRDLVFYNDEVKLEGELILPEGNGPFAAVVMIHGSAPDTRDIFYKTGDATVFLNEGIAVFIYDKRGTGASKGNGNNASLDDLADDAIAAVLAVKQQPEIDSNAVGVFGVSQGGTLGTLAASRSAEIDFVINITGSATPLANQEMWGVGNELAKRGFSENAINFAMKGMHLLYSARPLIQKGVLPLDYLWFVAKDPYLAPVDYWLEIEQPLFVAYGSLDTVVPTVTSVEIAMPIIQSGHAYNRLYVYQDAGHGIRRELGSWSDGHINTMIGWTKDVTSGQEPAPQPKISAETIEYGANRWYGIGEVETPWYLSAPVQLLMILLFGIIFLLAVVYSLISIIRPQENNFGRLPQIILGLSGLLNLSILTSFLMAINFMLNADAEGYLPPVQMGNWLSVGPNISILLTIIMLIFSWRTSQTAGWPNRMKVFYKFISLTMVGVILFLSYWGLIGRSL